MVNPLAILKIKNQLEGAHPKAASFVKNVLLTGIPEGTIIEITVTKPGEEAHTTNLKVRQEDLDALRELKNIASQG